MKQSKVSEFVASLFESLGPSLYRYALRSTGSRETAEDIVQEAFAALHHDLRAEKKVDNPRGWGFGAVRNQLLKHKRDSHADWFADQELDEIPSVRKRPEEFEDGRADVMRLISVLTRREEEVILLRMQSFKYREIGEQLGISDKSVAAFLARALEKLRKAANGRAAGNRGSPRAEKYVPDTLQ